MIKSRVLLAGALLVAAGAANAGVTVTPAVVSDYDFRGISQSAKDPAFQLSVNYTADSGFEEIGGYWSVTRYNDIMAVDTNHQVFSSEPTIVLPDPADDFRLFGPFFEGLDEAPQLVDVRHLRNDFVATQEFQQAIFDQGGRRAHT